jgi:hypothetical protein
MYPIESMIGYSMKIGQIFDRLQIFKIGQKTYLLKSSIN